MKLHRVRHKLPQSLLVRLLHSFRPGYGKAPALPVSGIHSAPHLLEHIGQPAVILIYLRTDIVYRPEQRFQEKHLIFKAVPAFQFPPQYLQLRQNVRVARLLVIFCLKCSIGRVNIPCRLKYIFVQLLNFKQTVSPSRQLPDLLTL